MFNFSVTLVGRATCGLISELFVVTNPGNGVSVFCKTTAKRSDNNIHSRQGGSLCTDVEG